jgi:hypothetical protein
MKKNDIDMITIKKGASKAEIQQLFQQLISQQAKKSKGFDAYEFSGSVKLKLNPLEYQKNLRNEWQ